MQDETTGPAEVVLIGDASSVRAARAWVGRRLVAMGLDGGSPSAMVVVSELVTNAVVHGGGMIRVVVLPTASGARVEVTDRGAGMPALAPFLPRADGAVQVGGWGLRIVEALSSRWGVRRNEVGKTVWAEIDRC